MSGAQYLGLDVGTQSTKGLVVDSDSGQVVARSAVPYGLIEGLPPGAAEQHPATWWDAVRAVIAALVADDAVAPDRIAGLGVSGQQHGFVALDARGKAIRPAKLWCDTVTTEEARELSESYGRNVPTGFTASKILWLKKHEPDAFARLATVLLPHDYINYRLTGELCMEAGDASGTGFFDPVKRQFVEAEVARIDSALPGKLPPLIAPDQPAGELTATVADDLGLRPGTLVAPGGGDNMMSAIGSGAVQPGTCVLSLGTSGTVFGYSDHAVVDPNGLIAPFCDSTGGWLPLLCVMNVTGVTQEVQEAFGSDLDELTLAASDIDIGSDGALFIPYLQGERVPDLPSATGALLGLRPGCLTPGVLFRAALEGTSLNIAWGVNRMRALGIAIDDVRVVGGGSRNQLWRSILADALAVRVQALSEPESAALGGALQAAWVARRHAGEDVSIATVATPFVAAEGAPVEPDADRVARYHELGTRFRAAVKQLYGAAR